MKGGETFLLAILIVVIAILGYYNYQQQETIDILNEEVFEQARLRHDVVLEKHELQQIIERLQSDSVQNLVH